MAPEAKGSRAAQESSNPVPAAWGTSGSCWFSQGVAAVPFCSGARFFRAWLF